MPRLVPMAFAMLIAVLATGPASALSLQPPQAKPQPAIQPVSPLTPTRIWSPQARIPIRLESVNIAADITGHVVRTRVELLLRNLNDQTLEGELQFPLRPRQIVTGFALDMGKELRPAVPVDKARGQQVFEDVTRTRVDPALLEATQGNNYKLRVYPIPGRGTRRVVLNLSQSLARHPHGDAQQGRFELPLEFGDEVGQLDVDVRVGEVAAGALRVDATGLNAQDVVTQQLNGESRVQVHRANHRGAAWLRIDLPASRDTIVATQVTDKRTTFYAEVPLVQPTASRPAPRSIAILWDASGSGARREHERELALLDAYFKALRQVEVQLTVVRDTAEAPRRFTVKDGRWDELRSTLSRVAYDGATNFAALVAPQNIAPQNIDLALVFSDGLGNWGAHAAPSDKTPTYAVGAATSVDAQRLMALSQHSGGEWLDLMGIDVADAVKSLQTRRARLVSVQGEGANQVVARLPQAGDGYLSLAGVLMKPQAMVKLEFLQADGRTTTQSVAIASRNAPDRASSDARADLVSMQWATMRIAELEEDHEAHRAEIRRIGKEFGLVTRETSLIVLDAVRDYVRYEIEPPASLRKEYEQLLAQQGRQLHAARSDHIDDVVRRFAEQTAWWERRFPKGDVARVDEHALVPSRSVPAGVANAQQDETMLRREFASPPPAAPVAAPAIVAGALARNEVAADSARDAKALAKEAKDSQPTEAAIQLTKWAPDSAYARRLRQAPRDVVYQRYLDERPGFVNSTAFFLDAADVLFDKGLPELGLRVLSNLAEMDLENRHILRVLGYRLLQAKQPAHAIRVFQAVQRLSPDEPQSYRDLGLAYSDAGQWQEAVDQLWEVVARPWNARFPDIDLTSLADLNAIAARAQQDGSPVRTQAFDQRLMRNLPLDLRIVLSWDADNTDIDLWVIDPNGEKAYYGHRLSHQGGRMSQDVTGGYGPEEFALRRAKPGHYTVQAQFYGHRQQIVAPATTLMMRLSTGFGTARQKEELVTLRLAGQSDMVTVGGFDVAP